MKITSDPGVTFRTIYDPDNGITAEPITALNIGNAFDWLFDEDEDWSIYNDYI